MALNRASLELIKEFEGWRALAYPDPATGGEPWTIGYGHTSAAGEPKVKPGMIISKEEGLIILARDLEKYEAHVRRMVKVPTTANQHGALTSLCYNIGPGNLGGSTLIRKLNAGDYAGAADQFRVWNKANKKVMAGLTRRRLAETKLFLAADGAQPAKPVPRPAAPDARKSPLAPLVAVLVTLVAGAYAFLKSNGVLP